MTESKSAGRQINRGGAIVSQAAWFSRATAAAQCLLAAIALITLVACAGGPPVPVKDAAPTVSPEQSMGSGDFAAAARAWERMAVSADPLASSTLRLNAAEAWLLAGDATQAESNLLWVEEGSLSIQDYSRWALARAELALLNGRPDEAEEWLSRAEQELPARNRSRYERLSAQTRAQLSRPGARNLSEVIELSNAATVYEPDLALALLQSLEEIPSGELALRASNPRGDRTLAGWLDLAWVIRSNIVWGDDLIPAMTAWKLRHPFHYMTESDGLDLWLRYRDQFQPPRKVAILLPQTGRLKPAADAIRDGIMSAYLDAPDGTEIMFINSGEEPESTPSAYFEARDLGAEWIIGPIQKPSIEALLSLAGLVSPVLALNDLPAEYIVNPGLEGQIVGISLSQEAELQALTEAAISRGYERAIILTPESEWGERMASGFRDIFLQDDRQIVASARYLESENDHSGTLERILMIDESKSRAQQLERVLQQPIKFQAVRRDDVDVIFLAANPVQGRQIRPQLKFHDAGNIPVYAPRRIYSGRPDRARDQDLNGVHIPLTPLEINRSSDSQELQLSSLRDGTLTSLFALGRDAWNLLPWLDLMSRDPDFVFPGDSGSYTSLPGGSLNRQPAIAVFARGAPVFSSPDVNSSD